MSLAERRDVISFKVDFYKINELIYVVLATINNLWMVCLNFA